MERRFLTGCVFSVTLSSEANAVLLAAPGDGFVLIAASASFSVNEVEFRLYPFAPPSSCCSTTIFTPSAFAALSSVFRSTFTPVCSLASLCSSNFLPSVDMPQMQGARSAQALR